MVVQVKGKPRASQGQAEPDHWVSPDLYLEGHILLMIDWHKMISFLDIVFIWEKSWESYKQFRLMNYSKITIS